MDNITTSLAFSMFSNKGVYALLLGSGISRNSGIPTGWDVVMDLLKKLSVLEGNTSVENLEDWFIEKYKEEPDYSNLLEKLASTPSERLNIMKPYFDISETDSENGLKKPTLAHQHIAKLVKKGLIKVIITTNFDKLLEKALDLENIQPQVIKHFTDIQGAMPLVHSQCTIIKINGDYMDSRFLNTKTELQDYDISLKEYLSTIFNDFGIISCGWSGKWDRALLESIRQTNNYRFGSYWCYLRNCEPELIELAKNRKGQILQIDSADKFFFEIFEKIQALEYLNDNHPLNADIAVARIKKYITKEENKILLFDLLTYEAKELDRKRRLKFNAGLYPNKENLKPVLDYYISNLDIILPMSITTTIWGEEYHHEYLLKVLKIITEPINFIGSLYDDSKRMQYIPGLFVFYSIGISCIINQNYTLLNKIFQLKIFKVPEDYSKVFIVEKLHSFTIDRDVANSILEKNYKTPLSTYLHENLKPFFQDITSNDQEFIENFCIFEYYISLNYLSKQPRITSWAPVGEYIWRHAWRNDEDYIENHFSQAEILQNDWAPLISGMFNSSYEHYRDIRNKLIDFLRQVHF
ncbi:SIR2 family protein [Flavobacterium sp. MFBS3-15]|uniref:SIR2 family protein n=1 Tax=Flavobacterium sp. MFBS3-15 TaxID=2989816 RepID=UPI0022354FA4|nr:SIR2 family protein [Flavobacterium sp. MFBS3-15]MCW4468340.1 SIR2 family protein [Flavobacterium sp. MFBS3-15]